MKKNLFLFGILVILLTATYFLHEKRVEKEHELARLEGKLIQLEITSLKLPHVNALLRDGKWWHEQQLLSNNHFKQLVQKISEIKSVKNLTGDWRNFATNPIDFEVNGVSWSIGDMSLDRQGFYIRRGDELYLAIIDGESTTAVTSEAEVEESKVNELKSLLGRSLEELREKQFFRYYGDFPLEKVSVQAEGNLPYRLLLKEGTTEPAPIRGISPHKDLRGKFLSLMTQMFIKEEVPYNHKLKFKKLASITFEGASPLSWELWLKDDKKADAYIIDDKNKRAFQMVGGSVRIFFIHAQDYWDKKVIPPENFTHFTRLPVKMIEGSREVDLLVINREPLDFEASGYKIKLGNMQDLFQMIFNLGPSDQAERVSELSSSERKQLLSANHLRLSLMGQDLLLWRKQEELIVVNLTQGFKAHFNLLMENFHGRMEDVLEL